MKMLSLNTQGTPLTATLLTATLLTATLLTATLLTATPSEARVRVGAQVGSATGLSAQIDLNARDALNLSIAYDLLDGWGLIGADYRALALSLSGRGRGWGGSGLYWGVGGLMGGRPERATYLSARLPLGVEVQPRAWRLQLFLEVAPTLSVLPATGVGLMGALGARWTF